MSEEYLVFAEVKENLPGENPKSFKISVNFGLCNYLDYFACPLIIAQKIYFDF